LQLVVDAALIYKVGAFVNAPFWLGHGYLTFQNPVAVDDLFPILEKIKTRLFFTKWQVGFTTGLLKTKITIL